MNNILSKVKQLWYHYFMLFLITQIINDRIRGGIGFVDYNFEILPLLACQFCGEA